MLSAFVAKLLHAQFPSFLVEISLNFDEPYVISRLSIFVLELLF